jgi:uracil-DNA glycosylase
MHSSWKAALSLEFGKGYFKDLAEFVQEERSKQVVFPASGDVFNAYKLPFEKVRVVILGQDPYHNSGQAHGLSFSVLPGVKPPPSLQNIFKELHEDLGVPIPKHGHLATWAEQGVFLLNATLTVRAHSPGSHQGKGWETFTDATINVLGQRPEPVVFVLWGKYARSKAHLIPEHHRIVESPHPSPMSAYQGFFGSRPFSKVNAVLGGDGINWAL